MKKQGGNTVLWFVIVIVVVVLLVYLTIRGKNSTTPESQVGQVEESLNNEINMETEGMQIIVVAEGTGEASKVGDKVAMNYTGKLADGTSFDSNVDPKFAHVQPFVFTLGAGQVIEGWEKGVLGMKVGEKRTLVIGPELAYGEAGIGGVIPPSATLTFDVELIAIEQ